MHWVRDVAFGEDACRANADQCPQNLAIFRNVALTQLRAAGLNAIQSTLRDFATRARDLLVFLRIMKN